MQPTLTLCKLEHFILLRPLFYEFVQTAVASANLSRIKNCCSIYSYILHLFFLTNLLLSFSLFGAKVGDAFYAQPGYILTTNRFR